MKWIRKKIDDLLISIIYESLDSVSPFTRLKWKIEDFFKRK